jgi:hypothetical protein
LQFEIQIVKSLEELVRIHLNEALAAPQHAMSFAEDFAQLDNAIAPMPGEGGPLTVKRVLLEAMQLRMDTYMEALAAEDFNHASELLALARLLGALHLHGLVPFRVIMSLLEAWLCEMDSVPEVLVEAAAQMVIAISPVLRAGSYANMGRAVELIVEVCFTDILQNEALRYCPRVMHIVRAALDLLASNWEFHGATRVVQCVPAVGDDGAERVRLISLSGELIHEARTSDACDAATLRMIIAKKLGLLEHLVSLISSDGRLLMGRDLI